MIQTHLSALPDFDCSWFLAAWLVLYAWRISTIRVLVGATRTVAGTQMLWITLRENCCRWNSLIGETVGEKMIPNSMVLAVLLVTLSTYFVQYSIFIVWSTECPQIMRKNVLNRKQWTWNGDGWLWFWTACSFIYTSPLSLVRWYCCFPGEHTETTRALFPWYYIISNLWLYNVGEICYTVANLQSCYFCHLW